MANELQVLGTHATTVYAQIVDETTGKFWRTDTNVFENYATADIANYAVSLTKQGTASAVFLGNFPTQIANGLYLAIYRVKAGGSFAESDAVITSDTINWSGAARTSLAGSPSIVSLVVNNPSGVGVSITGFNVGVVVNAFTGILVTGTGGNGVSITGNGGYGMAITGSTFGMGLLGNGGVGLSITGSTDGLDIVGSNGNGLSVLGSSGNVGFLASGGTAGVLISGGAIGLSISGGSSFGMYISGGTNGVIINAAANGFSVIAGGNGFNISAAAGYALYVSGSAGATNGLSNTQVNTALNNFPFLMTDAISHNPMPGLGATITLTRSIDGGAYVAGALTPSLEIAGGMYTVNFAASDMNGKIIVLKATAPGADVRFERIVTTP